MLASGLVAQIMVKSGMVSLQRKEAVSLLYYINKNADEEIVFFFLVMSTYHNKLGGRNFVV